MKKITKKSSMILNKIKDQYEIFLINAIRYHTKNYKSAARRARKASKDLNRLLKAYREFTIREVKG